MSRWKNIGISLFESGNEEEIADALSDNNWMVYYKRNGGVKATNASREGELGDVEEILAEYATEIQGFIIVKANDTSGNADGTTYTIDGDGNKKEKRTELNNNRHTWYGISFRGLTVKGNRF